MMYYIYLNNSPIGRYILSHNNQRFCYIFILLQTSVSNFLTSTDPHRTRQNVWKQNSVPTFYAHDAFPRRDTNHVLSRHCFPKAGPSFLQQPRCNLRKVHGRTGPGGRIRERNKRACERNTRHGGHMRKQRVSKILEACRDCWPETAFQGVPARPSIIKS